MSLFVYRQAGSDGAQALAQAVGGIRTKGFNRNRRRAAGDAIVCWGEANPNVPGITRVLNGAPILSKLSAALKLKAAGVPTVEVSQTRPTVAPPVAVDDLFDFQTHYRHFNRINRQTAREVVGRLQTWLATPVPVPQPATVWLARTNNHIGGNDLLHPGRTADFYARKEDIVEEYRIHCFKGKSIRAGIKKPVAGERQHEWVRSRQAGWFIDYAGFSSKKAQRELAANALQALGLDFGAVDIGKRRDGTLLVLEVNRAPGLEGNTITAYADAIKAWQAGS